MTFQAEIEYSRTGDDGIHVVKLSIIEHDIATVVDAYRFQYSGSKARAERCADEWRTQSAGWAVALASKHTTVPPE